MTPEEIAARVAETRVAQGFEPTISDPKTLAKLAVPVAAAMLAGADDQAHAGGGSGGVTRRRRPSRKQPTTAGRAAKQRTSGDGSC